MSRRTRLPGADELFRSTGAGRSSARDNGDGQHAELTGSSAGPADERVQRISAALPAPTVGVALAAEEHDRGPVDPAARFGAQAVGYQVEASTEPAEPRGVGVRHTGVRRRPRPSGERRPSGRERHDEKITVYVSQEELLDLEQARLTLRAEHGLAVDRGRIVREALSIVLADFEAKGEASTLVRRLSGR